MSSDSPEAIFGPDVISPTGQILQAPSYGYLLDKTACIIFVVLFSLTTALHLGQALYFRLWWLLPTVVLCGLGEILGWSGRLWSAISPLLDNPYLIQIVATIIAPTPFLGAIFMTFSRVTTRLGSQYSRITPGLYSRIFLTCDIISLVVQAVGGGMAASSNSVSTSNLGGKIMLGGIIFQLVSLILFICLASEYMFRYVNDRPFDRPLATSSADTYLDKSTRSEWDAKVKLLVGGLSFICVFIFIRSIYRTIELADGWNGRIIQTQVYFNVLDGAMIILSLYTFNLCHPWLLLQPARLHEEELGPESRFKPSAETL
ncbi:hypothetical protein QCA50_005752 [Cerrena zonata]|uniref:RTA1-domain-containing protein n=1 Tax=Cerrena zonata TaxID=2478898 RepID=A0AAW0GAL1_9APHY